MPTGAADAGSGQDGGLPLPPLLALATTGFVAILTETLPAGLLPQIAGGLSVSQPSAGQLVTSYAVGSLVAALPLTVWTRGWRRRTTLLAALGGFLVFNTVTAASTDFGLTTAARFLAGVAAGLAWGILSGYARRMVPAPLGGKALAVAMAGTPLALSLGVPAGVFLGAAIGWRAAFLVVSVATLALIGWVAWRMPDFPGREADGRLSVRNVLVKPGMRPILATVFAWMAAHNVLYTYVAPFAALSGLGGEVDLLLLAFGLAALLGIWITGMLVDRALRRLLLASLAAFAGVALALGSFPKASTVAFAATVAWGLSFGGAATQLQTAAADAAGEDVDLGSAMVTTVWNAAIASGGLLGGVLLDRWGADAFPWAILALVATALAIAVPARRHGFPPGARAGLTVEPPDPGRRRGSDPSAGPLGRREPTSPRDTT